MKYALREPITFGEAADPVTLTELTFREKVVAGDLRGVKLAQLADLPVDDVLKIAGRLTAQPDHVMARLSPIDLMAIAGIVGNFFTAGLETGTIS